MIGRDFDSRSNVGRSVNLSVQAEETCRLARSLEQLPSQATTGAGSVAPEQRLKRGRRERIVKYCL